MPSQKDQPRPNIRTGDAKPNATWSKSLKVDHAKTKFVSLLRDGYTVEDACRLVGWASKSNYKYHKGRDKDFAFQCDKVLSGRHINGQDRRTDNVPDFPEFSEKYLGQRLFSHQLQWYDLLEGRTPRDVHHSQRYEPGDKNFIVINTPPGHSKSTTITQNYVTWRIVQDPQVRIMVVSKTQGMAKKFLHAIQQRLTSQRYKDLITAFAPPEGFDGPGSKWRADQIYVAGIDSGEKDPTVEAVGIGGHIYGARADLIILDDCVTLDNVGAVENQIDWIQQEVMSRVDTRGRMIVVGTRVAPVDLYTELMNPKRYPDEKSAWTYLSQPAVLEMADDPADWVPLWPYSNQPALGDRETLPNEDGLFPKFTGHELYKIRSRVQPRTWAMVYMQQQVDEEAVFPAKDVQGCVDGVRYPGALHKSTEGGTVGTLIIAHGGGYAPAYVLTRRGPARMHGASRPWPRASAPRPQGYFFGARLEPPVRTRALSSSVAAYAAILLSGRPDSNRGPPAPKAGALPDCATPRRSRLVVGRTLGPPAVHRQRSRAARGRARPGSGSGCASRRGPRGGGRGS